MKRLAVAAICLTACVSLSEASLALAQARAVAATQCLYSGPVGRMTGSAVGEPTRDDVDADGRAVLLFHKVQTNHDFNDPFKKPVFAEKPTCRFKLDCVVSKQGLEDIGIQTTRQDQGGDPNVWTRVGFSIAFKYADAARNKTCHIVAIDSL